MAGRTPALVAPPPHSANNNHKFDSHKFDRKSRKKRKSSLRVFAEIIAILLLFEVFAYRKLSDMEREDMRALEDGNQSESNKPNKNHPTVSQPLAPAADRKQRKADQAKRQQQRQKLMQQMKEERAQEKKDSQNFTLYHDFSQGNDELASERLKTANKLHHMGVSGDIVLSELPAWSQILDNFNSYSQDDEPVVLGMEYCEAFRTTTNPKTLGVGPAGLFSTGTNLIAQLVRRNCMGPNRRIQKFALIQVPYGKHNPANARFHHQVKNPKVPDREAILPVVAIRHPYTWMSAMCKHSYRTRWKHKKPRCHESLFLENPILEVPWGFKEYNETHKNGTIETHKVKNSYDSLAHMWLEWYKPYFLADQYNQTPRLIVRHEDLVYRPEKVVKKICECVGGTNFNKNPDWEHPDGFEYEEESANKGQGHGKHGRSGLYTAVVKYGQPLRNWYEQYNGSDRKIMKETFQGESDPVLRTIFEKFQYRLFDDVEEPTKGEKMRARKRAFLEQRQKDLELLAQKEAEAKE